MVLHQAAGRLVFSTGVYWFALHGKEDDTPSLEAQSAGCSSRLNGD